MKRYKPTIGLEVHIEPRTASKMFCNCPNDSLETLPNKNTCPICLGHPGTMPVANLEALKSIIRLGMALDGEIAKDVIFDRKSYFYPDLPKGYQISQYETPVVSRANLIGVRIKRIHLEEDAGKLIHESDKSLVDFNRAGVPLIELVTEPDIDSAEKAVQFTKELQLILRYLHLSNADMEHGEMRLEANISIREEGESKLGTKVEIKNLNSFKSLGDSINYEIKRQQEVLESGNRVIQETRGWNAIAMQTFSQRVKEASEDYRYLVEPDLPVINLSESKLIDLESLRLSIPELPEDKRRRLKSEYGLNDSQANSFVEDRDISQFFESTVSEIQAEITDPSLASKAILIAVNYILTDLRSLLKSSSTSVKDGLIRPSKMASLCGLIASEEISSRMAKDILVIMNETGDDPQHIIRDRGMTQVSDHNIIADSVREIINEHPSVVNDYKSGKTNALQFLLGQAMKKLKGQGNPAIIKKTLEDHLM